MTDQLECETRIRIRGKTLTINKIIAEVQLFDLMPPKILDPVLLIAYNEKTERRDKMIDLIAAQIAYSINEAIYKIRDEP